jgi:hypothetical protein
MVNLFVIYRFQDGDAVTAIRGIIVDRMEDEPGARKDSFEGRTSGYRGPNNRWIAITRAFYKILQRGTASQIAVPAGELRQEPGRIDIRYDAEPSRHPYIVFETRAFFPGGIIAAA